MAGHWSVSPLDLHTQFLLNFAESIPVVLVGKPLPGPSGSDEIKSLAPPSFESQGKVQSRYINAGNLEYTLKNARNKYDFKENQDDPVFLVSLTNSFEPTYLRNLGCLGFHD